MSSRFIDAIQSAGAPRILVAGDLILDTYILGRAERISPEAPIQVLEAEEERRNLGGAANVAVNLRALGARVDCCGVVGADPDGELLLERLAAAGIDTAAVLRDETRPTVSKTRLIAHNQQLLRVDRERRLELAPERGARLLEAMRPLLAAADAVAISDYAKGTLSAPVLAGIMESGPKTIVVDPKGLDFSKYRGARLITPNKREAEGAAGMSIADRAGLAAAARALSRTTGAQEVVITLGPEGMYLWEGEGQETLIPAQTRAVYDVTGAGDTVIAHLAFFLTQGCPLPDAARIANAAAGIVVGRLGVAAPTRRELADAFLPAAVRPQEKILDRSGAALIAADLRRRGEKLVFTNGCFDLIHGGHLEFLRAARSFGDRLMVAVNDDESVRRLKGRTRPILGLEERLEVLASLQVVDFVTAFSEDTPEAIIREVAPQVLAKGEDWRDKGVVGAEFVASRGGEVRLVALRPGRSTTEIVRRILELGGAERDDER